MNISPSKIPTTTRFHYIDNQNKPKLPQTALEAPVAVTWAQDGVRIQPLQTWATGDSGDPVT